MGGGERREGRGLSLVVLEALDKSPIVNVGELRTRRPHTDVVRHGRREGARPRALEGEYAVPEPRTRTKKNTKESRGASDVFEEAHGSRPAVPKWPAYPCGQHQRWTVRIKKTNLEISNIIAGSWPLGLCRRLNGFT